MGIPGRVKSPAFGAQGTRGTVRLVCCWVLCLLWARRPGLPGRTPISVGAPEDAVPEGGREAQRDEKKDWQLGQGE